MTQPTVQSALRRPTARWALATLALAGALGMSAPAQAAATASVQVLNLSLTLVDLTPDDGQAAQASWADGSSLLTGQIDGPAGTAGFFSRALPQAFGTLADGAHVTGAFTAARIGAGGLSADGSAGEGLGFSTNASSGFGLLGGGIVLGAGTGLRLSLDYALQASVDGRDSACSDCDTAQAQLLVVLGLGQPDVLTAQRSVLADTGLQRFADADGNTLQLGWDNTGAAPQTVGLGLSLSVAGLGYSAAPVPEPGAALLMCAGLGVLARVARQRR